MSDKSYKHISYGTGFRIKCRLKTWKEKTFWEKVKFWKQYKTALHPVTFENLNAEIDSLGFDAKKAVEGTFEYESADDEQFKENERD